MKKLNPIYLLSGLLLLGSCAPKLYITNTPNIPNIDSINRNELKLNCGFSSIELQSNMLLGKHFICQSALVTNLNALSKPLEKNIFRRFTTGFGNSLYTNSNSAIYNIATLGYSKTNSGLQDSYNVLESLFGNPSTSSANISGEQYHFGFTSAFSKTYSNRRNLKWVNSFNLEYTSIPKLAVTNRFYSDVNDSWRENSLIFKDLHFIITTIQSQIKYPSGLEITFGLKIPWTGRNWPYNQQFYITQELVYLRLGYRLNRFH